MIKKIGYCILSLLLFFIILSPFRIIYTGIKEGNYLYYLLLIMIVFFLPSLFDLLLSRENRIFCFENLARGFIGLVATGILSFCYGELSTGALLASGIVIPIELFIIYHDYTNELNNKG